MIPEETNNEGVVHIASDDAYGLNLPAMVMPQVNFEFLQEIAQPRKIIKL